MIAAARAVLFAERLWPALWPSLGIAALYAGLALSGFLSAIPAVLHLLLLFALAGSGGYFLWRDLSSFTPPSLRDAARRIEQDSALSHRPLTEGADLLAAGRGDALAEHLWQLHLMRLLASAQRLRLAPPKSHVAARDPYRLRYAAAAALVLGFALAGADSGRRLIEGLVPNIGSGADRAVLNAWLTPPAYTGLPPQSLNPLQTGIIHAPRGSTLTLRLRGSRAKPWLRLAPAAPGTHDFARIGDDYEARAVLNKDSRVSVRLGMHTYADWHVVLGADVGPAVAFTEPPGVNEQQAVKFAYRASDDYGVVKMEAHIQPVPDATPGLPQAGAAEELIVPPPVPPNGGTTTQTAYRDLTPNAYAGLKVTITLVATDGAGQTGKSAAVTMTLPERVFTKPLAQALIEQRRALALSGLSAVPPVRDVIDALTFAPERFYQDDFGTYLALRTLYSQLTDLRLAEDVKPAMDFLWDIALGLEEGDLSQAANALRDAQAALNDALERGASDEEIDALMQKMREAMSRYLQSMAQNGASTQGPPPPNTVNVTPQDLSDLLSAIQELSRTGARDQARQLLAQLSQMMENMRAARPNQQQSPQAQATNKALQDLSGLMAKQRDLLDRTFRDQQANPNKSKPQQGQQSDGQQSQKNGGDKSPGQNQAAGLSKEQKQLKDELDNIMGGLVKNAIAAPHGLDSAGEAMGKSADDLDKGSLEKSAKSQEEALQSMRDGAQALSQSQMAGDGKSGTSDSDVDPLGRNAGSTGFGGSVKLPQESQLARAREILNELRRRAGERNRPQEELDYLDRLLKRF